MHADDAQPGHRFGDLHSTNIPSTLRLSTMNKSQHHGYQVRYSWGFIFSCAAVHFSSMKRKRKACRVVAVTARRCLALPFSGALAALGHSDAAPRAVRIGRAERVHRARSRAAAAALDPSCLVTQYATFI